MKKYEETKAPREQEPETDDFCDLDPSKKCDNCFKCLEDERDYASIMIDRIILDDDEGEG
ncbi:MAG: hypothetical protein Q4C04_03265 [Clostridia bacterium]|nr:hypothetical protein [Clostridia bacterium]